MFKKALILFIFILLFYILLRLVQKRIHLLNRRDVEGLTSMANISDPVVKSLVKTNTISPVSDNVYEKNYYGSKLTIKDFHIKSCFHSAFNGTNVSKDMVLYLLHRGYRVFDFEVFYDKRPDDTSAKSAMVSVRSGNFYSDESIFLRDVLDILGLHGFSSVSNKDDPLFVQIRPHYKTPNSTDTEADKSKKIGDNTQLNTHIESALEKLEELNVHYRGPVSANTTLDRIKKKMIVIMDANSNKYSQIKSNTLINRINMNPSNMSICMAESRLDNCSSDSKIVQIRPIDLNDQLLPENPETMKLITSTSCNICFVMAWNSPFVGGYSSMGFSNVAEYELMFANAGGSAFILVKDARSYAESNNPNKLNSNKLYV